MASGLDAAPQPHASVPGCKLAVAPHAVRHPQTVATDQAESGLRREGFSRGSTPAPRRRCHRLQPRPQWHMAPVRLEPCIEPGPRPRS